MNTVTQESIDAKIVECQYQRVIGTTVTLCLLTMANGIIIVGKSACVDPDNFDKFKGEQLALEDAKKQIWPLEGYLLAESLQHWKDNVGRKVLFQDYIDGVNQEAVEAIVYKDWGTDCVNIVIPETDKIYTSVRLVKPTEIHDGACCWLTS
jgi:hypothetical protein